MVPNDYRLYTVTTPGHLIRCYLSAHDHARTKIHGDIQEEVDIQHAIDGERGDHVARFVQPVKADHCRRDNRSVQQAHASDAHPRHCKRRKRVDEPRRRRSEILRSDTEDSLHP